MAGQLRTPRPYRSRRSHVLVRHALSDWVDRVPNGQPRYPVVKQLNVAVLGTGRLAETHVAALAALRDAGGIELDGQRVAIEPALYGRDADKVRALAGRFDVRRVSQ